MSSLIQYISFSYLSIRGCLHETSFLTKSNIFISLSGQFLITAYTIQPEIKFIAGVILLRWFWQKWNFISGDKISCKNYPKWNQLKIKICACVYFMKTKMIGFYWMCRFSRSTPETKFHFVLPEMKINVNRIYFMMGWNLISGLI